MTDTLGLSEVAVAWVEALVARGVTLKSRGKQLEMLPKSSYGELSNDERATLKRHKAAIIAVVRERHAGAAGPSVQAATLTTSEGVAPTSAPAPEPCKWCYRAPCIGADHPAFLALHPEAYQQHADELAMQVMLRPIGRRPPWDY